MDYPSWDDVQRAKSNEAAKASEVTNIQGLIAGLESEVQRTQAAAQVASDAFYTAQQEYFDAAARADQLQQQADQQAADGGGCREQGGPGRRAALPQRR